MVSGDILYGDVISCEEDVDLTIHLEPARWCSVSIDWRHGGVFKITLETRPPPEDVRISAPGNIAPAAPISRQHAGHRTAFFTAEERFTAIEVLKKTVAAVASPQAGGQLG